MFNVYNSNKECFIKNYQRISKFHCTPEIQNKGSTFRSSLFRLNAQTYLLTLWRSRDQPSLGPAVARTPPLLNSPSGRLSSRLNVVDWLLFSLQKTVHIQTKINMLSVKQTYIWPQWSYTSHVKLNLKVLHVNTHYFIILKTFKFYIVFNFATVKIKT